MESDKAFVEYFFLRCTTTFDFNKEFIFFHAPAVPSECELPSKKYIDPDYPPPPLYESRSHQMVAGFTAAAQLSKPMQQQSSEVYNNHKVSTLNWFSLTLTGY